MKIGRNIALIGFMGTGKTTVGQELARRLEAEFVDMDDVIVQREGKPIPRIFSENGEPYFRNLERKLVEELSQKDGLVIGTGGGVILNPENTLKLSQRGLLVCLSASPETILQRVEHDSNRPLLAGDDKMQKILQILETRREFYRKIPLQVDTTGLTIDEVVQKILLLYASPSNPS